LKKTILQLFHFGLASSQAQIAIKLGGKLDLAYISLAFEGYVSKLNIDRLALLPYFLFGAFFPSPHCSKIPETTYPQKLIHTQMNHALSDA